MKLLTTILLAFSLLAIAATATNCGNKAPEATEATEEAAPAQGKEHTSAYICPMYCPGSGSDAPGKCPECGMDYVENKKQDSPGHEGHGH